MKINNDIGKYILINDRIITITGIRPETICGIYNETVERVSLEHLSKICKVLKCDIEDLIQYIPDEEYYKNKVKPVKKAKKRNAV